MRLTTRLGLYFLLLAVLPLGFLGWLSYRSGRLALRNAAFDRIQSVNSLNLEEYYRWVAGNERYIRSLAQRPLVVVYAATMTEHGASPVDHAEANDLLLTNHFLPALRESPEWKRLTLVDASDGQVFASTETGLVGTYRDATPAFVEGRRTTWFESPFYDASLDETIIAIGTPVVDNSGALLAVLVGHLDAEELSRIVANQTEHQLTASLETYFVNQQSLAVSDRRLNSEAVLTEVIRSEGIGACLAGASGARAYLDYRGLPVLGAYTWIPEHRLCMITEIDEQEALQPTTAFGEVVVVGGVLTAMVAALLGWLFARSLLRPVNALVASAHALGQGDLLHRVRVKRRDELGDLAEAVNQMAANLEQTTASRDELNREIEERKRIEAELARKARELERSNEELQQFAYVASHDLQEPLRMVTSFLQLLDQRFSNQLDDDGREYIAYAVDGAARMKTLIQDLLAYSRVGSRGGGFGLFAMNSALDSALASLRLAIAEKSATVTRDDLPVERGDRRQIEQLLTNLLSNALKFSNDLSPQVHVGVRSTETGHQYFVQDNGIGIDPQFADRIFVIFQRLHNREQYPGTGIGLAICRRIVDRHNGEIWVESQPGQGATFFFTLRVEERTDDDDKG